MEPWQRAQAGLFLAMQYPTEVPGVSLADAATRRRSRPAGRTTDVLAGLLRAEAGRIGFDERFLARPLNVDLSGGEKKRNETLQLGVLRPKIAMLDELDSGSRRRRAAGLCPPHRAGDRGDRPRRAGHHPLQPAAARAPGRRGPHPRAAARSAPPAVPSSPSSSRRAATRPGHGPRTPNPPTERSPTPSPIPSVRGHSPSSGRSSIRLCDLTRVRLPRFAFCAHFALQAG